MHILSPVSDNCPSWISKRERMTIENILGSISMNEWCTTRLWNSQPPDYQSDTHPTELPGPEKNSRYHFDKPVTCKPIFTPNTQVLRYWSGLYIVFLFFQNVNCTSLDHLKNAFLPHSENWAWGYKTFFIFNSVEHEIFPANKY